MSANPNYLASGSLVGRLADVKASDTVNIGSGAPRSVQMPYNIAKDIDNNQCNERFVNSNTIQVKAIARALLNSDEKCSLASIVNAHTDCCLSSACELAEDFRQGVVELNTRDMRALGFETPEDLIEFARKSGKHNELLIEFVRDGLKDIARVDMDLMIAICQVDCDSHNIGQIRTLYYVAVHSRMIFDEYRRMQNIAAKPSK
jgi:hypothetical protein